MKSIVMALAAAMPLALLAADSEIHIDAAKLKAALPATELLDKDMKSANDREAGEIDDIVISRDGKVQYVMLELDDPEASREASSRDEDRSNLDDMRKRGFEIDDEMRAIRPNDIRFNSEREGLQIAAGAELHAVAADEENIDGMRLSGIIGMEVNLADEDSFGEVEDVMLSKDGSEVVALVVDNWDGLDKQRRALPFDNAIVKYEEDEITFPYTEAQVKDVAEFNLDAYRENSLL